MGLIERIKGWFSGKKAGKQEPEQTQKPERIKKTCKKCGKTFSVDPAWGYVPTFCKECKQRMAKEKEQKQKTGELRDIKRKCKACGKFFTFPSNTGTYPTYCPNCRKRRQQAQKEKYSRKK